MAEAPRTAADAATGDLLEVRGLRVAFDVFEGRVHALDGVSFSIRRGQTLCVVGESGSGKSITARSIMNIVPQPGRVVGGRILLERKSGERVDVLTQDPHGKTMRSIRGDDVGMVFQEPMSSLSPVHTIGSVFVEAVRAHRNIGKAEAREMAVEAFGSVGIARPEERQYDYPFQLSGGMRQRAMIAIALANRPHLLIADEPTTALDVTTQANVLDLMRRIQAEASMAVMFITHDLGVVAEIADDVVVMYLGTVVETGEVDSIFHDARHPYTRALLRSIPGTAGDEASLYTIEGSVPSPIERPAGCPFHTRCDAAVAGICESTPPPTKVVGPGRTYVCHLPLEGDPV